MAIALPFQDCPIIEVRRYTLHPGLRQQLLDVFERHLIEPQEAVGMTVGGTFTDDDDPNVFTWLRGFADHESRRKSLEDFYHGPIWAEHRDRANATMVSSDDVLLLRPTAPPRRPAPAVERGSEDDRPRKERALLGSFGVASDHDESWWTSTGLRALEDRLGVVVSAWRTDPTPNLFPALPVREDRAVSWLAVFADAADRSAASARLDSSGFVHEIERRTSWYRLSRLTPTSRSAHPVCAPLSAAT
ncbi:NIPSNAP family protein [Rhodococcus rhodnii]|uniref:NIPSNAP domain-containing protein n=1 Tax=Rhodococcus rhodnii LMG 5362 TaxID=1273125 RepID=R7WWD3_9NOCA|nr:NIPSNAP family protein [Rhodococcus rhodnii]EOM78459.1 hypothetical protein Rrhod_0290 [Rhodococcus rhodnii LMG 5362]